jgi:hypothetical protein
MTSAALAGLLLRQPFQPFSMWVGDRHEITIERPEQVKHEPGDRIVTFLWPDGEEYIIDLERVALITVKPPKPRRGE